MQVTLKVNVFNVPALDQIITFIEDEADATVVSVDFPALPQTRAQLGL